MRQGQTDISTSTTPEWVKWTRHKDEDGRPYYIYYRRGYPPAVRRSRLDATGLLRIYNNDRILRKQT